MRRRCVQLAILGIFAVSPFCANAAAKDNFAILETCMHFADEVEQSRALIKSASDANGWNHEEISKTVKEMSLHFDLLSIAGGPVLLRRMSGEEAGYSPFSQYLANANACLDDNTKCGPAAADALWHELDTRFRTACRKDYLGED